MKLLIVDDQNSVHMFFEKMLSADAFGLTRILHAYNGKEALELLEAKKPDIMMLDVKMPVMDGMETLCRIKEMGICVHTIILSAYNEFEYARQALLYDVKDYLLKPIDWKEVSDLLTSLVQHIKKEAVCQIQYIMADFLKGQEAIPDTFVLPFETLDISGYGFLCFRSEDLEWTADSMDKSIICSISTESSANIRTESSAENFTLCLAAIDNDSSWETLWRRAFPDETAFIGFSLFQEDAANSADGMKQAVDALKQGFYEPGIYLYEENFFSPSASALEMEIAEQIQTVYTKRDVQQLKLLVERLFNLFRRNKTQPEYVQEFCYSFLLQLNKDFITTFQKLKGSAFLSEFNCYDAASLKNMVLRIIINMQCDFEPSQAGTDSDVVCRIKEYIDLHYDRDLSLDTMSKHFFIGKYQISRIFKKTYDINYSDYILKIRMENAALLLKSTSCKLYEIAHRTGFEETSYFSNVFKKYYGITPNEYRKEK